MPKFRLLVDVDSVVEEAEHLEDLFKDGIEAENEEEAENIIYNLRYNYNNEWTRVGDLIPDDKLVDFELIDEQARNK